MTDREIIDAYFSDPLVKSLLEKELGKNGRISVDWEKRIVVAQGQLAHKKWDLDEMLTMLKQKSVEH